jgi:hypothetical protein
MKTYFHYLYSLIKKSYQKDSMNIIGPIWFAASFALMFAGAIMFGVHASPGNFGALWWLLLTAIGIILSPFVILPILVFLTTKYDNYKEWKLASNHKQETEEKQTK